jgi:hypothetical protein
MKRAQHTILASAILASAALAVSAHADTTGAAAPATQTVQADSMPASQPALPPTALTAGEQSLLADVRDGDSQLDEAALYALLAKAKAIAAKGVPLWQIDRPAVDNLLAHPARYRGWPVVVRLRIARVEKLLPPKDITPPPSWPKDRPVWKLACYAPAAIAGRDVPLLVFTLVEPPGGASGQAGDDRPEDTPRDCDVGGYFYKVARGEDVSGRERNFPVILAWSFTPAGTGIGGLSAEKAPWLVILLALLALFVVVQRLSRRAGKASERAMGGTLIDRRPPGAPEGPGEINPALLDALREGRDKEGGNEPHGES